MKKKRFALIFSISLMAMLVMVLGLAAAASAADSASVVGAESAPAAQKAPAGIVISLTDVSAFPPYTDYENGIPVYFDHNEGIQTPFYGGGWIGVLISNTSGSPQSVELVLKQTTPSISTFPPYSSALSTRNTFMLGKGQPNPVLVEDIPDGSSQIYYFYVFTPRFKNDPAGTCEIFSSPGTRGDCGAKHFRVEAYDYPATTDPAIVSGTLVMDRVQTANPGTIEKVVEDGGNTFTLTVYFESGNLCTASGSCAGTFNPTTYFDYNAGVMHIVHVSAVATATTNVQYPSTNRMRLEVPPGSDFALSQDPVKFTYVFERDPVGGSVTFNPSYAANSGSDNYKGGADMEGVPTAITLLDLEAAPVQPLTLAAAAAVFLLGTASILVLRKRQRE